MSVDVVTFGCRLNIAELEAIRRAAGRARRSSGGEYLRGDGGSGAPGAAEHPAHQARAAPMRASSSPAARRRSSRRCSRRCPRSSASSAIRKNSTRGPGPTTRACRRRRHHGGEAARRARDRSSRGPYPRLSASAERLRSPLHVLHHSVRARQFALAADGRSGGAGAPAGRARLSRTGAHRRRYHQLRAAAACGWARWSSASSRTSQSSRVCGCRRSIRSRPMAICSMPWPTSRG